MRSKPTLTALSVLCLSACAAPSSTPAPTPPISPSLLAPCPPHLQRPLTTWGDLAQDYAEILFELAECRSRHRALVDAVQGGNAAPP